MKGTTKCPCGCGLNLAPHFVDTILAIEKALGTELEIVSGARCEKYNTLKGFNPNSAHTLGLAVDVVIFNSRFLYSLIKELIKQGIDRWGDGYNKGFWHFDIAGGLPVPHPTETLKVYPKGVCWRYG